MVRKLTKVCFLASLPVESGFFCAMYFRNDFEKQIYEKAEQAQSWLPLAGYYRLLFRYQVKHKDMIMPIASYVSHKLGRHRWCGTKYGTCAFFEEITLTNCAVDYKGY